MLPRSSKHSDYYVWSRANGDRDCPTLRIGRKRIDVQVLDEFECTMLDVDGTLDGLRIEGERRLTEARALASAAEQDELTAIDNAAKGSATT